MPIENTLTGLARSDLLDTFLPDFVLAFAFFTSLIYAVMGRRLGQNRSVAVMSAALGMALSAGLVGWERYSGLSIRDLGPLAAGFAIIILAGVMYQAIRHVGGNWAGAGIALGASILVGWIMGVPSPVQAEIVQTVMSVALTVGVLALLLHHKGCPAQSAAASEVRHDMRDLDDNRRVSDRLDKDLHELLNESRLLSERPEGAVDFMRQLKQMLPAEGWLTERMARLRERSHLTRKGHIAKLEETRHLTERLTNKAKKKLAADLIGRYDQLAGVGDRLERLEEAVATNERKIRQLTAQAEGYLTTHQHKKLPDLLEAASKLQHHNSRLFRTIDRTERQLVTLAEQAAKEAKRVGDA